MKHRYCYLVLLMLSVVFTSCEYDNYEAPKAMLQGRIVYQGDPINLADNQVSFELWEPGWQLRTPINVPVAQDGTYSASLFDATYKLVFRPNQAPFRMKLNPETNSDTIMVNVSGTTMLDIEVEPYYMIRNSVITLNSGVVNASASLEQIVGEDARNVERVSLYINKTQFVDARGNYNLARTDVAAGDIVNNNIGLSVNVPELLRSQSYIYARIGVKLEGIEQMLYSPVQKLQL